MIARKVARMSLRGLDFLCRWEGFRPEAYNDGTGVVTIGYGTTSAVIDPLPSYVTPGQALALVERALTRDVYPAMVRLPVRLSQAQWDALCDAAYNLGAGVLEQDHSLGQALRSSDWRAATPEALLLYEYAGAKRLPGLVTRREAEAQLWRTGRY